MAIKQFLLYSERTRADGTVVWIFEIGSDVSHENFIGKSNNLERRYKLLQNDFLGQVGRRTLFCTEPCRGKSIKNFSDYLNESEILLLPGTKFKVVSILQQGPNLHTIQLQEVVPRDLLLQTPMTPQDIQNERVQHRRLKLQF